MRARRVRRPHPGEPGRGARGALIDALRADARRGAVRVGGYQETMLIVGGRMAVSGSGAFGDRSGTPRVVGTSVAGALLRRTLG